MQPVIKLMTTLWARLNNRFDSKQGFKRLAVLRISLSSICLLQIALYFPEIQQILGEEGYVQWEISEAINESWQINVAKIYYFLKYCSINLSSQTFVTGYMIIYTLSVLSLLLGFRTKLAAFATFCLHYVWINSLFMTYYGVDVFLQMSFFYFLFMPVGETYALDSYWKGRESVSDPAVEALSIKIFRMHLCLIYFSSGIDKALNADWWDGNAIWYTLNLPSFQLWDLTWLVNYDFLLIMMGIFVVLLEIFYGIFMLWRVSKPIYVWLIVFLHLGIGIFLGLWLFSFVMIALTYSLFGNLNWFSSPKLLQHYSV